ncbi:ABC transporter transmembrane domain-containing protein, partial [Paractinoplanes ovalisporus]|uniref:ABC transporter ATP-binding protein/permease n=1 Tax=Paractinoplanes ovalisporus TaxID=2810368 RepID=UPI003F68F47D
MTAVPSPTAPVSAASLSAPTAALPVAEFQRSAPPRGPLDPRLVRHARTSRAGIAGLALLGAGQAGVTVAVAVALTLLVTRGPGWPAAVLLGGAFAARAALSWAEQVVARRTAARVADELRRAILTALPRRGPAWVASFGTGRLTAVLTTGVDALKPWFSGYLPALVLGVVLPPMVIVAMALVDPASAVVALVTLPLIPVLGALTGWATQAQARRRWQADARLAGHFLDVVRGLPTLRVFGRADRQTATVETLTDQYRSATMRVLRVAFLSSTALDLVGTLSVGLIAVEAGLRVASGNLALGPALLVILLAPEAYRPLREMAARYHASTDATAVISDVDEILTATPSPVAAPHPSHANLTDTPPAAATPQPSHMNPTDTPPAFATPQLGHADLTDTPPAVAAPRTGHAESSGGVVVLGLRARYPGTTADAVALDDLVVRPGEIVALAGPSGAGKTTALRALAGLHAPSAGLAHAANALYLPQRPTLPHARVVADLFPAGTPDAEMRAALRDVGLSGELTPDTPLGERGIGVSAGQRQRLALAALLHQAHSLQRRQARPNTLPSKGSRPSSLLKEQLSDTQDAAHATPNKVPLLPLSTGTRATTKLSTGADFGTGASIEFPHTGDTTDSPPAGPPITLLLDEPTAHLDADTESLVIDRLRAAARSGVAILVVAHRPALLAAADRVVELSPPPAAESTTQPTAALNPTTATGLTPPASIKRSPQTHVALNPASVGPTSPPDAGGRTPPSDAGDHTPPSDAGDHTPPSDAGDHTPPSDAGDHTPPSDA